MYAAFGGAELGIVIAIAGLLIMLVFLAVAETAINRISKPKAQALVEEGGRHLKSAKALMALLSQPEGFMNPILVLTNLAQTGQAFLTSLLVTRISGSWFAGVIAFLANFVLFFVLTESMPKTWALQSSERGALFMARPTLTISRFTPLRMFSKGLISLTNVLLPGKGLKQGPFVSEREFLGIVDAAVEDEVIEHEERELIESVIEFGDTMAREVMVPRPDIVSVDVELSVSQALDVALEAGYSRIPVIGDDRDDVVGIAYAKDMMRAERSGDGHASVRSVVRPPAYVPETKPVAELMREMQAAKYHFAVVVDEYGAVAGIVTLEDCIEELVGDIVDEYDTETAEVEHLADGEMRLAASLSVGEVNELLDIELPDDDWDTVGGFVFSTLGHVPTEGEYVDHHGHRFVAEKMDGRRVALVRVVPVPGWVPPPSDDDE